MIMKRTLRLLLTVGLSLVCVSLFAQKFPNYPIPQQPDTLRILGIGNSFTDDWRLPASGTSCWGVST